MGTFSGALLLYGEAMPAQGLPVYTLLWTRRFEYPIVSILAVDIDNVRVCVVGTTSPLVRGVTSTDVGAVTSVVVGFFFDMVSICLQDGLDELVVSTLFCVHVLRLPVAFLVDRVTEAAALLSSREPVV